MGKTAGALPCTKALPSDCTGTCSHLQFEAPILLTNVFKAEKLILLILLKFSKVNIFLYNTMGNMNKVLLHTKVVPWWFPFKLN